MTEVKTGIPKFTMTFYSRSESSNGRFLVWLERQDGDVVNDILLSQGDSKIKALSKAAACLWKLKGVVQAELNKELAKPVKGEEEMAIKKLAEAPVEETEVFYFEDGIEPTRNRTRYPFDRLKPGQSLFIPNAKPASIFAAAYTAKKKFGYKLVCASKQQKKINSKLVTGVRVWRLSDEKA